MQRHCCWWLSAAVCLSCSDGGTSSGGKVTGSSTSSAASSGSGGTSSGPTSSASSTGSSGGAVGSTTIGSGGSSGTGGGGTTTGSGGGGATGAGGMTPEGGSDARAPDGGTSSEAGPRDASVVPTDGGPGSALDGFLFDVPCQNPATATGRCNGDPAALMKMVTVPFGGSPGTMYTVQLHFCGPVEGRACTGCTMSQATYFCTDGTPATTGFAPSYPVYKLDVSEPMHSYYLNNRNLNDDLFMIDYSATIQVAGGATLTLSTTSTGASMYTAKMHNFVCPNVPGITQPYAGQFVYVRVESVNP